MIMLFMDSAPCHRAGNDSLIIPKNIHLVFQPPYSPEVNPAECVWSALREKFFSNRVFKDMDAVIQQLVMSLQWIESEEKSVQSLTRFSWMKDALERIS